MAMKIHHNIKILALMILVALSSTGIDWLTHYFGAEHVTEPEYSSERIVYMTILGLLGLAVLRNENNMTKKAVWISLVATIVLHSRYYLQGYDPEFVVLFVFIHFLAIFLPMLIVFRNFPELFGNPSHLQKKSTLTRATKSRFRRFGRTGQ